MSKATYERCRKLDHALAFPMFVLSIVVLALYAAVLHMHELQAGGPIVLICLIGLGFLYPLFWIETFVHWRIGSKFMKQHIWFCILPITRIGCRDHDDGQEVWLPKLGWRKANRPFERKLTRLFSIPMITVALCVLPVIVIEFFYKEFVAENPGWYIVMKLAESAIWAAFTFEFIVMISVVKYPMAYTKKHWIDLAIILLPMVLFIRAFRLSALLRLKYLSKTARVYRLRGLGMRLWRAFVALEVVEMLLLRDPIRRLAKLEVQLEDRLEEIELLEKDITRVKQRIESDEKEADEKEAAEIAAQEQAEVESDDISSEEVDTDSQELPDVDLDPDDVLKSA